MIHEDVFRIIIEFSPIEVRCALMSVSRAARRTATDPTHWSHAMLLTCAQCGVLLPFRAMTHHPDEQNNIEYIHIAVKNGNIKLARIMLRHIRGPISPATVVDIIEHNRVAMFIMLNKRLPSMADNRMFVIIRTAIECMRDGMVMTIIRCRADIGRHIAYITSKYRYNWYVIESILHSPTVLTSFHVFCLVSAIVSHRRERLADVRNALAVIVRRKYTDVEGTFCRYLNDPCACDDIVDVFLEDNRVFGRISPVAYVQIMLILAARCQFGLIRSMLRGA